MLAFLSGLVLGCLMGIVLMCILILSDEGDD